MFSREEMRRSVAEFLPIYASRPVRDNAGGMGLNHSWATCFILRALRPPTVVESGVYRGHSTWLIEQAAPDAAVYSFDPDLAQRDDVSPRARYSDCDFTQFDWSAVDIRNAVYDLVRMSGPRGLRRAADAGATERQRSGGAPTAVHPDGIAWRDRSSERELVKLSPFSAP